MLDTSERTNSNPSAPPSMFSKLQRYSWTFRKWWWVILITTILGVSWMAWMDSRKPPSYASSGRMMVVGKVALPDGGLLNENSGNFYGTQCMLMESVQVRQRAASRVESKSPELRASAVYLNVTQQKGTDFFNLTAIGEEPNYTQAFLNACMDEYIRLKREMWAEIVATKMISLVEVQMKEEKQLDSMFQDLLDFQKKYNLVDLEEEGGNSAAKHLAQMKVRLDNLKQEYELMQVLDVEQNIERKQQSVTGGTTVDGVTDASSAPFGAEEEYLRAKQQLQLLKAEKERRAKAMRPKHPLMIRIDAEISQQEGLIKLYYDQSFAHLANQREAIHREIETLEKSVKEWNERSLELAGRLAAYNKLKSKVDQSKAQVLSLQASNTKVGVDRSLQDDVIQVMDQASVPEIAKPGLVKDISVGAFCGILAGLAVVFLIGALDDRVTSSIELRERFPEPLLGHIPLEAGTGAARVSLLTVNNKQGIFVEAYRNLRSTLHFMSLEEPRPKAFLITSAVPGEGKSTVAVNLGIILAGGGTRTLLVDADLRKGLLHNYFSVEAAPGLIEVLNGEARWQDSVVETDVKNLSLLPRGKGGIGPSELFITEVADNFLREVYAAGYDRVIFDSAPILATDDTACLAPKIDATLFVVRAEASSMRLTRSALDTLLKRQVNVLGLILNAANLRSSEYQYYHKYGDYYSDTQVVKK